MWELLWFKRREKLELIEHWSHPRHTRMQTTMDIVRTYVTASFPPLPFEYPSQIFVDKYVYEFVVCILWILCGIKSVYGCWWWNFFISFHLPSIAKQLRRCLIGKIVFCTEWKEWKQENIKQRTFHFGKIELSSTKLSTKLFPIRSLSSLKIDFKDSHNLQFTHANKELHGKIKRRKWHVEKARKSFKFINNLISYGSEEC